MRRRTLIQAGSAALFAPGLLRAGAPLPSGPVRIVVGFAPGGGTDVLARLVAQKLTGLWGTQVIVENKPGATGVIAAEYVAKQPADGTTLLMAHVNSHAIAPALLPSVRYDPRRDFAPISMVGVTPNMLTRGEGQKVRSVAARKTCRAGLERIDRASNGALAPGNAG